MDDKKLKDMWKNADNIMGAIDYEHKTIEGFIKKRSNSVADKIKNMIKLDIGIKWLIAIGLLFDAVLYYNSQTMISYICFFSLPLLIPLIMYEMGVLRDFSELVDYGQNTREKLMDMLTFLKSRFFNTLLSFASTYLFGFTAGMLLYFYITYGYLRRLGSMDVFVFSTICLIGIVMNFVSNSSLVKYHKKHIELCLSDLNDNSLEIVSQNIETRQKLDHITKILIMVALLVGLLVFIAILKSLGI
jgi:hypothetical protein